MNGTPITDVGVTQKAASSVSAAIAFGHRRRWCSTGEVRQKQAEILVDPQNHVVGASTALDGVPVLGDLAGGMAMRAAQRGVQDGSDRARNRLSGASAGVQQPHRPRTGRAATASWNKPTGTTGRAGVWPTARGCSRPARRSASAGCFQAEGEPSGVPLPCAADEPERLVRIYIHESLFNNLINRLESRRQSRSRASCVKNCPRLRSLRPLVVDPTVSASTEDRPATRTERSSDFIKIDF